MQNTHQDSQQGKTERRDTGGLPVAQDATQRNEPPRTPENQGDRDDHLGGHNQSRERQGHR